MFRLGENAIVDSDARRTPHHPRRHALLINVSMYRGLAVVPMDPDGCGWTMRAELSLSN